MKPNCPYKPQERDGDQKGKISKVNAGTTKVTPGGKKQTSGKDAQGCAANVFILYRI